MSLKQWIRFGLIAAVVLAAFGAFAAIGSKKSEAASHDITIGQLSGTIQVSDSTVSVGRMDELRAVNVLNAQATDSNSPLTTTLRSDNLLKTGGSGPEAQLRTTANIAGAQSHDNMFSKAILNQSVTKTNLLVTANGAAYANSTVSAHISPPATGDAGLAPQSSGESSPALLVIAGLVVFALAGAASLKARRRL